MESGARNGKMSLVPLLAGVVGGLILIGAGIEFDAVPLIVCGIVAGIIAGAYVQLKSRIQSSGELIVTGIFVGGGMALAALIGTIIMAFEHGRLGNLWGVGIALTLLFGIPSAILGAVSAGLITRNMTKR